MSHLILLFSRSALSACARYGECYLLLVGEKIKSPDGSSSL